MVRRVTQEIFYYIYVGLCLYKSTFYYVTLTRNYVHNVYEFAIIVDDNIIPNNSLYQHEH